MIPKECKRLAEVDFPIAAVSRHAVREKRFPVPRGLPSTLHHWWARRPLASSRAVLLALLLPDPCDPHCPENFKVAARQLLPVVGSGRGETDTEVRQGLLKFISDFANWDMSAKQAWLETGRALVKAAHGSEPSLVVDPFAGGGSIPLEALRLGCEAFASDLNPVACLILKVMLEDIPRHGPELADDLRVAGAEIKRKAERKLAELYPTDPDGATPIAYLWARTVVCEAPDCGAEIPLMRSFWLSKKLKRKRALRHSIDQCEGSPPNITFEVFEPKTDGDVRAGTVTRAKAACLCCRAVLPPERVRAQLAAERGGADVIFDGHGRRIGGAQMTAVVTLRPNEPGRHYRLPTEADYAAVRKAQVHVAAILDEWERSGKQGLCPVPDEPLPPVGTLGFRVQRYGMLQWGDLFTARQKAAFVELCQQIADRRTRSSGTGDALPEFIAVAIDKVLDFNNSLSKWRPSNEDIGDLFARQALPIAWDFAETNAFGEAYVGVDRAVRHIVQVIERTSISTLSHGSVLQTTATEHPLPDQSASVPFTDPPYYDAIPYSDLSDFFLVWLKRALPDHLLLRDPFDPDNPLSPKQREAVQDETKKVAGQPKDRAWFEKTMASAFAEGRRVLANNGVGSVIFAHKTTEGWEALLSGMIRGGWTITGSWPIATEMGSRLRARDSAALATSVHLICRPRSEDAPVGDWAEVLRELPARVADWMERLQGEGVRGADLVFACIGPALEIFSRYRAVETAEGRQVGLPEYLEKVWEVVGRAALEQVLGTAEATARNGMAGALEEDARLTALFLWALQSTEQGTPDNTAAGGGHEVRESSAAYDSDEEVIAKATAKGFRLPFDVVRRFSQPMGIDLDRWTGRLIAQEKGIVCLLPVSERAKALLGADGIGNAADWIETGADASTQKSLFPDVHAEPRSLPGNRGGRSRFDIETVLQSPDATSLDRVHAAMLLQANGHSIALQALIISEQERGPDFLRLANALSALYPRGSREKRLLDAMLLAVPG